MGYPDGAGPEAGAFGAVPMTVSQATAPTARPRPTSQPLTASLVNGRLVAVLGPASSAGWDVPRISVKASVWSICRVYLGTDLTSAMAAPEESITYSGDGDEYDANSPIYVPPGQYMFIVWDTNVGTAAARVKWVEVA